MLRKTAIEGSNTVTEKLVAEVQPTEHPAFNEFVATIEALRSPDGAPGTRSRPTRASPATWWKRPMRPWDAIEADDVAHMREELGDVLLQVVLQSQIAADAGEFTIDDVCRDVNAKIVRRHPHVFGDVVAGDANEVLDVWDQIKMAEKESADAAADVPQGLLDGVPKSFPALKQAQKISRKAASAGFEWETVDDVWAKVDEEVAELKAAYAAAPKSANGKVDAAADPAAVAAVELEMGDVLFSLVNVARKMGVQAEEALRATCGKFRARWAFMEGAAARPGASRGRPLHGGDGRALAAFESAWGRWPRLKYGIGAF